MKKKPRLLAALLACVLLLTGCGSRRTEPEPYPEPAASSGLEKTVAYVPLDDRPDNVERVEYLAESLGYTLVMPERDLYRTALDHQPLNENGTQCGEPWALYQWVLEQEVAECDRYILSLDQLHSGGLVSSRSKHGYDISLPDGGSVRVYSMLEELLETLAADENNVVWLLDSVMRLAPTVGYEGGTLEEYNWIRSFGALPRRTLEGEELNLENIEESYWWGADGEHLRPWAKEQGQYEATVRNLQSRGRKLLLSEEVQRILSGEGYGNFRLLIGIDDSSLEDCIQKNEIAYLRRGLRAGADGKPLDWLLAGVDDLAFKAVARMYLDETGWGQGYSACVQYFGGTEDRPACDYDFQPLAEVVAEHFDFFDLHEDRAAELQVLVLTQPEDGAKKREYIDQLLRALKDCRERGLPVILIDASNAAYGTAAVDALTEEAEMGWLLSYAGMLDMAIVTGTALSHGAARYAVLKNGGQTETMERAFARTLADSVLKDFCYKNVVRNDLLAYVRNDLGGDPNNFWAPEIDLEAVQARLESGMETAVGKTVRNLEQSNFITSLEPYAERGWGGVALENYRFPWDRAFEIGMDIRLGAFTEPHEKILGLYYR